MANWNTRKMMNGACECCGKTVTAIKGYKYRTHDTDGVTFINTGRREVFFHFDCAPEFIAESVQYSFKTNIDS